MLQVVVSPMIMILMTLEVSFMLTVVRMMSIRDAPSCGVTYDHHSDNTRGVIYAPGNIDSTVECTKKIFCQS